MALSAGSAASDLFGKIQELLGRRSDAARLAEALYAGGAAPGERPNPERMAADVRDALAFIADKPKERHKIRVRVGSSDATIEILNDDMPFLVDSIMGEMQARGLTVETLLHPLLRTRRSPAGRLEAILSPGDKGAGDGRRESFILLRVRGLPEGAGRELESALSTLLDDVRIAVSDWSAMASRVGAAIQRFEREPPEAPAELVSETIAFLKWLVDGHFTFLGVRDLELSGSPDTGDLTTVEGSGLGLLRNPDIQVLRRRTEFVSMTPEIRRFFFGPSPLIITKANVVSRVHRRVHMDYIGIKTYGADRKTPAGEIRIVGLFTSQAYTQSPRQIPFLRHKVETVLANSGHPPESHDGKAIVNILETFPRDELFQIGVRQLGEWVEGILALDLRPRVRVFARVDRFERFVSLLVYAPRERYNSSVRERIGALLARAYNGRVSAYYPFFPDGPLVRVQFIIALDNGRQGEVDPADLERQITEEIRTWDDRLAEGIAGRGPDSAGLARKYGKAFSAGYAETFGPDRALEDIARLERLGPDMPLAIDFHREGGMPPSRLRAAVYRFGAPIRLSERVPVLENMGFSVIDERSYRLTPHFADGVREVALHDMVLETLDGSPIDLDKIDSKLEDCFLAVFHGDADNDSFNRLIVSAGAAWREAAVIRAYAAYLRQLGTPFGPRYIAETLNRHAGVTRDILELFHVRLDPGRGLTPEQRAAAEAPIRARIEGALANVPSLDEDRILRTALNLVGVTVRTNFYQPGPDGRPAETIAFKFDSKAVEASPKPRPYREIWVYSPRVEGIHLRFAPIARGGIRWSDRAQDFRTEVLGLVKAQLVKNAVIVPSGAKGGFLPKQLPRSGSRDETMKEGIAAYRIFISALLDITDNLVEGRIVPPRDVVRYDGDDPYLVVAADKGTATFSDFANEISAQHGFWLGDAFASGGSVGYDHKGMGITARGAWECVKRHFREMDVDIQTTPFRVVGVGDMSGDVFGNGMLLSPHIRLLAAFDHRDVFIDPEPDAAVGLAERRRLFDLPRSSWQDYDKSKISKGGGVFPRSSKSIPLSDEMRKLLGTTAKSMAPAELMRSVLKIEADLLWFGGIGTYVRASGETDEHAGDRANDAIRISGADVRCKVIGEGANLGVTQLGRIEFAQRGGRINTDFIDNSAGVNTSDQEVNIKIAIGEATRTGALKPEARVALLTSMTDDVARSSLRNNYQQSLALSLVERRAARDLGDHGRLMHALEDKGLLDRSIEALPTDAELPERQRMNRGLTRPEIAVLLSYAKIALEHDILQSKVPDTPVLDHWLTGYFPLGLRSAYADGIRHHRLRREIIATGITNAIVNRGGPAMAVRLADEAGRPTADVAYAFLAAREVFALPKLWARIDALDDKVAGDRQIALYQAVREFLQTQTLWFLRDGAAMEDLAGAISRHTQAVAALSEALNDLLSPERQARLAASVAALAGSGVPADLASDIARLDVLGQALPVSRIADDTGTGIIDAARAYFAIGDHFRLADLAEKTKTIATPDYYDRLALAEAEGQLGAAAAAFTREALKSQKNGAVDVGQWIAGKGERLGRARATLVAIAQDPTLTVSRLTVAAGQLRDIART